ncbi:hypothetical protein ABT095_02455 [Kitasatospora sp. NPDC002227]|uniref:hypothetical protein n=1 Tax=Kitasatospora sp. NPDC002227 TaxID=3154773 RepID=UPI003317F355
MAAAPSAVATSCPPPTSEPEPSGTEGPDGFVYAPLPDEIRCLPGVAHAVYFRPSPSGPETAVPEELRKGLAGGQLLVDAVDGTPVAVAEALCQTLTRMGYAPGGAKQVTNLMVSAGPFITYSSLPDRPSCRRLPTGRPTPNTGPTQNLFNPPS